MGGEHQVHKGKQMSDLVEIVARAIVTSKDGWPDEEVSGCKLWELYDVEARAAIAAVAEWLDNSHKLDDDSKVSLALRAAAGSALEAKP